MVIHIAKRLLLPVAFLIAAQAAMAQAAFNLDFEDENAHTGLPAGWYLGGIKRGTLPSDSIRQAYRWDAGEKQHGRHSMLIDWTKPYMDWTAITCIIPKTYKGKSIALTGYVKTEDVKGGAGLWLRTDGRDHKAITIDNMEDRPISGTTGWQKYTVTIPYDQEEARSIAFGGLIRGSGKMWIDNLSLRVGGKDIAVAETYTPEVYNAELDTAYSNGSGIQAITYRGHMQHVLTTLGMLWGFIKYYHAGANKGGINMDAALFRVLPAVLQSADNNEANAIMERWVDGLGKPEACKSCKDFVRTDKTKEAPDFGYLFSPGYLPKTLTDKLEYIRHNRYTGKQHYYIAPQEAGASPFRHELPYAGNTYPDAGVRLLCLYRYWNMVQYFYPDKHLTGEDWNKVLEEFIPSFCAAADSDDYQMACLQLIARIHDSHANIWHAHAIDDAKGLLMTPLQASFVQDKLIVTGYYRGVDVVRQEILPGDEITAIGGTPVAQLVKKYLPLTPGSNYDCQLRDMPGTDGFLLRSEKADAYLSLQRDARSFDVTMPRIAVDTAKPADSVQCGYKMLPGNIGYIYPEKLTDNSLDTIKELFAQTRGLIIDMRCYPGTFMPFTYGDWLKPAASRFVDYTISDIDFPGSFDLVQGPENGRRNKKYYKGKVVIIVDANTQSQAEYTVMALATAPNATVIGSTTAGADGDVASITLPGGLTTMFSGIGILYPDGTETQRQGIKIDQVIKPAINGIKEGRDELLEAAVKLVKQ